ncbi:Protein kinase-like domain containing protein [Rhypophila decipiens]
MNSSPACIPLVHMSITASMKDDTVIETITHSQTPIEGPAMDRNTSTAVSIVHYRERKGTMRDELRAAAKVSAFGGGKKFIPPGKIQQIVSRKRVRSELDANDMGDELYRQQLVHNIFSDPCCRKIFAILSLISRVDDINICLDAGLTDNDLPYYRTSGHRHGRSVLFPERMLGEWPETILQAFEEYQWMFFGPFLNISSQRIEHHIVDDEACLPFLLDTNHNPNPIQVGFPNPNICDKLAREEFWNANTYAIKQIHDNEDAADLFAAEVAALKRLANCSTQRVIQLLATYEYRGRYHLIFLWADGNLLDMWENSSPPPTITTSVGIWLADEILGVVEGLQTIQAPHGDLELEKFRHGDLKPENILCFSPTVPDKQWGRSLKIADLGLAKVHIDGLQKGTKARTVAHTPTYRPPECDIGDQLVTERYDTWSLGCVFLEFMTWILGGCESLLEFENLRVQNDTDKEGLKEDKFFETVQVKSIRTAVVKQSIIEWSYRLRAQTRCTRYIDDMISMIMSGMLQVNPRDRITTENLLRGVREMREKCNQDALYFSQAGLAPDGPTLTDSATAYTCPFRKRNPLKFNVTDHTTCALSSYPDIPQVKKHVLIAHMRPNDADSQITDDFELGVSAEVCDKLRNRKPGHQILEWNTLWAVLFPNDTVIPTGEYEPVIEDHEVHRKFLKGSGLFRSLFRTMIQSTREDTARSEIGNGPIADDRHLAQAVISQQLGFRTLSGTSSQPTCHLMGLTRGRQLSIQWEIENESFQLQPTLDVTTEIPVALDAALATNLHEWQSYQELDWNLETLEPTQQAGFFSISEQDIAAFDLTQFVNDLSADGNIDFSGFGKDSGIFHGG